MNIECVKLLKSSLQYECALPFTSYEKLNNTHSSHIVDPNDKRFLTSAIKQYSNPSLLQLKWMRQHGRIFAGNVIHSSDLHWITDSNSLMLYGEKNILLPAISDVSLSDSSNYINSIIMISTDINNLIYFVSTVNQVVVYHVNFLEESINTLFSSRTNEDFSNINIFAMEPINTGVSIDVMLVLNTGIGCLTVTRGKTISVNTKLLLKNILSSIGLNVKKIWNGRSTYDIIKYAWDSQRDILYRLNKSGCLELYKTQFNMEYIQQNMIGKVVVSRPEEILDIFPSTIENDFLFMIIRSDGSKEFYSEIGKDKKCYFSRNIVLVKKLYTSTLKKVLASNKPTSFSSALFHNGAVFLAKGSFLSISIVEQIYLSCSQNTEPTEYIHLFDLGSDVLNIVPDEAAVKVILSEGKVASFTFKSIASQFVNSNSKDFSQTYVDMTKIISQEKISYIFWDTFVTAVNADPNSSFVTNVFQNSLVSEQLLSSIVSEKGVTVPFFLLKGLNSAMKLINSCDVNFSTKTNRLAVNENFKKHLNHLYQVLQAFTVIINTRFSTEKQKIYHIISCELPNVFFSRSLTREEADFFIKELLSATQTGMQRVYQVGVILCMLSDCFVSNFPQLVNVNALNIAFEPQTAARYMDLLYRFILFGESLDCGVKMVSALDESYIPQHFYIASAILEQVLLGNVEKALQITCNNSLILDQNNILDDIITRIAPEKSLFHICNCIRIWSSLVIKRCSLNWEQCDDASRISILIRQISDAALQFSNPEEFAEAISIVIAEFTSVQTSPENILYFRCINGLFQRLSNELTIADPRTAALISLPLNIVDFSALSASAFTVFMNACKQKDPPTLVSLALSSTYDLTDEERKICTDQALNINPDDASSMDALDIVELYRDVKEFLGNPDIRPSAWEIYQMLHDRIAYLKTQRWEESFECAVELLIRSVSLWQRNGSDVPDNALCFAVSAAVDCYLGKASQRETGTPNFSDNVLHNNYLPLQDFKTLGDLLESADIAIKGKIGIIDTLLHLHPQQAAEIAFSRLKCDPEAELERILSYLDGEVPTTEVSEMGYGITSEVLYAIPSILNSVKNHKIRSMWKVKFEEIIKELINEANQIEEEIGEGDLKIEEATKILSDVLLRLEKK